MAEPTAEHTTVPPVIELAMGDAAKRQVLRSNMALISILAPLVGLAQLPAAITGGNLALAVGFLVFALSMIPLTYAIGRRMVDRARIVLGDGTYTVHGWGRTKRFTVADVDRVVTVDRMAFGMSGATHHLIVLGPTKPVGDVPGAVRVEHVPRHRRGAERAVLGAVRDWAAEHGRSAADAGTGFYAWCATESATVARVRAELVAAGIERSRVHAQGYWHDRARRRPSPDGGAARA